MEHRHRHGDALHVGDLIPSRPGLEVFKVDENTDQPADWMADARTGAIIWQHASCGCDNGRGVSADIWAGSAGAESWSSAVGNLTSATGAALGRKPASANFLAWWDADPVRELLDGTHIDKYGTSPTPGCSPAATCLQQRDEVDAGASGDLFGDWREEVVWRTGNTALRIYTTPDVTDRRIVTLHARHPVPGRHRLAEHRLQPAAAPELLHRRRHEHPAVAGRVHTLTVGSDRWAPRRRSGGPSAVRAVTRTTLL